LTTAPAARSTATTRSSSQRDQKPGETYLVRAGEYEAIYGNMPPFGLGKASRLVPLADAKTARDRFRAAASGATGQPG
jgi:hypothetical protein